jgi:hypothetical protein
LVPWVSKDQGLEKDQIHEWLIDYP